MNKFIVSNTSKLNYSIRDSLLFCYFISILFVPAVHAVQDGSDTYVLATGDRAVKRLEVSELAYGKNTKLLLNDLGIRSGLSILIMACGTGEQLPWASEFVGHDGHVTCADISGAQLSMAKQKADHLKNVSFIQTDILNTHDVAILKSNGSFDLVMSRFVLVHLTDPKKAIINMYSLIKKDGYLICEEHDVDWINSFPHNKSIGKAKELLKKLAKYKQVDFNYGSKVLSIFYELGYKDAKIALSTPAFNTGIEKHLFDMSLREGKKAYLDAKLITEDEMNFLINDIKEFADQPATWISLGGFFQVYVKRR